jgi:hypothetical protein
MRWSSILIIMLMASFGLQANANVSKTKKKKIVHRGIAAEKRVIPKPRYKLQTYYIDGKVHHRYVDTRPEKAKAQSFEGSDAGIIMKETLPETSEKEIMAGTKKKNTRLKPDDVQVAPQREPESSNASSNASTEVDPDDARELDSLPAGQ